MRDLGTRTRQREIWITQGHLWALALVMFFIGVLAFFVGLLYGRSQATPPEADVSTQELVSEEIQGDALDELLARLESLDVEDPQDGALSFPGTLPEGEAFPVPEPTEAPPVEETVVLPGRDVPEAPEGGATAGDVPRSGWAVQLASYASTQEADAHIAELTEQGHDAYRQAAMVGGVTRHRVRVGGYSSRKAAERGRQELETQAGITDALVVQAP